METRASCDSVAVSDLADYAWLTGSEGAHWLAAVCSSTEPIHCQLQRLRKVLSAKRGGLVVEQVELRRRAETKFGPRAAQMFFTEVAMQQATDLWIAEYKAARFSAGRPVHDYCCGIGGDLLALAGRGPVAGWDRAPEVVLLAEANLRAAGHPRTSQVSAANVEELSPGGAEGWHLDPDRRHGGRRSVRVEAHSPGLEVITRLRQASPHGALKLAPAAVVPAAWERDAELEWISWNRQCRQLVVWFDQMASAVGRRRATVVTKMEDPLAAPVTSSFVGDRACRAPQTDGHGPFLYDADPAVREAGLTGALAVDQQIAALGSEAGYLTGARRSTHALLTAFEVLDRLPLRVGPLGKHLRELGVGRLEIKKRGVETDPEQLRRQLKLQGDESRTLLLTRLGKREIAFLARRCGDGVTDCVHAD